MPDRPFRAEARHDGDDVVVEVEGDFDVATVPALTATLDEALADDHEVSRVVIDLSGVEFVDSSGLTALIKANRRAGEEGVAFALRSPSARVLRTLELTQLTSVLALE